MIILIFLEGIAKENIRAGFQRKPIKSAELRPIEISIFLGKRIPGKQFLFQKKVFFKNKYLIFHCITTKTGIINE